jgi:hypothetical protein
VDVTWYVIRLMAAVGLAWDVQPVPERIYQEAKAVRARRNSAPGRPVAADPVEDLAEETEPAA